MIKSMTAFAGAEKTVCPFTVRIEIRSYNSRHLDLVIRIPGEYQRLEEKIKGLVSASLTRGRVEVMVRIRNESEATAAYEVNAAAARAYYRALADLKEMLAVDSDISLDQVAGAGGIIRPAEVDVDVDACWALIAECIGEALGDLEGMRQREGDHIARDLSARLGFVEQALGQIEKASGGLLAHYQERLKERVSTLLNGLVEIDPGRIAQEAAFLADKSDISEEIVRARSHIQQFRSIAAAPDPAGRKLNFLLQEFNREFNTMGAKTASQEVSHTIVDVKSELEKMREQVQNVE